MITDEWLLIEKTADNQHHLALAFEAIEYYALNVNVCQINDSAAKKWPERPLMNSE